MSKSSHPDERFLGKTAVLSLGYGCGREKFHNRVRQELPDISRETTDKVVTAYRERFSEITRLWRQCGNAMHSLTGMAPPKWLGDGHEVLEAVDGGLRLPNGTTIRYHGLDCDDDGQWRFVHRGSRAKLYGGKVVEHGCQALARIVVSDAWMRLARLGWRVCLQVHDELVLLSAADSAAACLADAKEEMCRTPVWAPGLPLAAEGFVVDCYGDAK